MLTVILFKGKSKNLDSLDKVSLGLINVLHQLFGSSKSFKVLLNSLFVSTWTNLWRMHVKKRIMKILTKKDQEKNLEHKARKINLWDLNSF